MVILALARKRAMLLPRLPTKSKRLERRAKGKKKIARQALKKDKRRKNQIPFDKKGKKLQNGRVYPMYTNLFYCNRRILSRGNKGSRFSFLFFIFSFPDRLSCPYGRTVVRKPGAISAKNFFIFEIFSPYNWFEFALFLPFLHIFPRLSF